MTEVTEKHVLKALSSVNDPDRKKDIVSLGMVSGLTIKGGHVAFAIEVDAERGPHLEPLRKAAEDAVNAVAGVLTVSAVLTAERAAHDDHGHGHDHGHHHGHGHGHGKGHAGITPSPA